jgi:hypothetical protein
MLDLENKNESSTWNIKPKNQWVHDTVICISVAIFEFDPQPCAGLSLYIIYAKLSPDPWLCYKLQPAHNPSSDKSDCVVADISTRLLNMPTAPITSFSIMLYPPFAGVENLYSIELSLCPSLGPTLTSVLNWVSCPRATTPTSRVPCVNNWELKNPHVVMNALIFHFIF